jgi:hypothetical protein
VQQVDAGIGDEDLDRQVVADADAAAAEAKGLSLNKCFIRPTFEAGTYSSIRRGRRRGEC